MYSDKLLNQSSHYAPLIKGLEKIKLYMDFSVTNNTENVWRGKMEKHSFDQPLKPSCPQKPLAKTQLPLEKL